MWEREKTDNYTEPIGEFYDDLDILALVCLVAVYGWQYSTEENPGTGKWRVFWNDLMGLKIRLLNEGKNFDQEEEKKNFQEWFTTIDDVNIKLIDRQNPDKTLDDLREKSKKVILMVSGHVKKPIDSHLCWLNVALREVVEEGQTLGVIDPKDIENILQETSKDVSSIG